MTRRRAAGPASIGFLLTLLGAAAGHSAETPDPAYLADLTSRAIEAKLAEEREWRVLLHYRPNFTGGVTSEVDDPEFFLSPAGKTDPRSELEATLAQFFSAEPVGRAKQPAQCAFIARYHWLKARLSFDDHRLPPAACERFHGWFGELNPQGVSMIFPSAYLNNPASMFGHTFLRIDQKGQTEQTRILAYTINFAADAPGDIGFTYAMKGVFGGFKGFFSTLPYYLKVQEYRDIENRDIWEYRLNLTDEQIHRLLMHAWEIGNVYVDYYFFKENCSYQILWLLEYANPDWHLVDQFVFWTVPADTIRLLVQQPGLVGEIAYRPARSTVIKRKREVLSDEERGWLSRIVRDAAVAKSDEFARLPVERRAFVLDLASDYLRYKGVTDESRAETYKERNRAVLVARSELRVKSEDVKVAPYTSSPETGHKTSRAGVGLGWRNGDFFEDLSIRAGYHDLLDPEPGYSPDAQIEIMAMNVRHYTQHNQYRLEKLTVANILSLSPMDRFFHSPSWKVSGGWETVNRPACRYCGAANLNGGPGAALESRLWEREVYFAFAEVDANYGHAYRDNHRIGGGGTVGMLANLSDRWKFMVSTTYLRYPIGEQSDDFRWFFGTRYALQQNLAVRFEYSRRYDDSQAVFYLQGFF
ncbi:MAG: DUF4105 domain-containing protein [Nitrospirota bacterium]